MKDKLLIIFGNKIRELRNQKNWSQEKLAEETDFHRTYIGMIERGERNLSLLNVQKFAKAFDLPIEDLFKNL
ncbi:helix-turn-helix transcriptional regulator [Olleya marilimosa]|nr:helix-turn-helix transcriptional regulator [Olleya marilimosa]MBD3892166.1 helix-turn-helix transcriptional regulator [Olleya marilimosa]